MMNEPQSAPSKDGSSITGRGDAPYDIDGMGSAIIVDNVERSCRQTAGMLQQLGYKTIRRFRCGADAMFEFLRSPCNVFLTVYELPEINGYQLGRRIKFQRPETWVVIITGLCRSVVAEKVNDREIDAWLFTPFCIPELQAALTVNSRPQDGSKCFP